MGPDHDPEAVVMCRLLNDYHILPRDYLALDDQSKAFLIACCQIADDERAEAEKKRGN